MQRLLFEETQSLQEFSAFALVTSKNPFCGLLLEVLGDFWANSFANNVALTELFYKVLTCPFPLVYKSLLEGGVCEILSNLLFVNDFAIRNMSDSKTIALLERMRQEMDFDSLNVQHQQAKELDRIASVKSLQRKLLRFFRCMRSTFMVAILLTVNLPR